MVLISKREPYFIYRWNQVECKTSVTSDSVENISIPIPYYEILTIWDTNIYLCFV